jgi:hypothetical protein
VIFHLYVTAVFFTRISSWSHIIQAINWLMPVIVVIFHLYDDLFSCRPNNANYTPFTRSYLNYHIVVTNCTVQLECSLLTGILAICLIFYVVPCLPSVNWWIASHLCFYCTGTKTLVIYWPYTLLFQLHHHNMLKMHITTTYKSDLPTICYGVSNVIMW